MYEQCLEPLRAQLMEYESFSSIERNQDVIKLLKLIYQVILQFVSHMQLLYVMVQSIHMAYLFIEKKSQIIEKYRKKFTAKHDTVHKFREQVWQQLGLIRVQLICNRIANPDNATSGQLGMAELIVKNGQCQIQETKR